MAASHGPAAHQPAARRRVLGTAVPDTPGGRTAAPLVGAVPGP